MRKGLFCAAILFCAVAGLAQKTYGVAQDYYVYRNGANRLVPAVYYQTEGGWKGQLRFNYEEAETLSLIAGKVYAKEGRFSWSLMPQAGLLLGRFTGVGAGLQAEIKSGLFSLSVEPQYCASFGRGQANFFYNWTELCAQPASFFYAGFALQQTKTSNEKFFSEPGFVLGLEIGKLELPLYYFKPKGADPYFVAGLHWRLEK